MLLGGLRRLDGAHRPLSGGEVLLPDQRDRTIRVAARHHVVARAHPQVRPARLREPHRAVLSAPQCLGVCDGQEPLCLLHRCPDLARQIGATVQETEWLLPIADPETLRCRQDGTVRLPQACRAHLRVRPGDYVMPCRNPDGTVTLIGEEDFTARERAVRPVEAAETAE